MKKINILIFIMLIFAFILTGCSGSKASGVTEGVKVNKEDLKIGFVHYSDPSDQGYTYTHDSSTWKMAAALGIDKSQIINKYNVPDTAEAATAFRELAEDGCQIIFSTSHGHEDYLLEVAFEYPNVVFCHFSGVKAASSGLSNVHNYFGDIAQVRYLSGVVAGLTTKTNKIGYVCAMDYTEVNNGLDAYYLGAKSVNPDIEVSATYLNKWYAPALEGQATKSLIDSGCDVISHHADSTAGAVTCQENGAFFIPYNSDMSSAAPNAVLTSVRWDTSSYLIMAVQNILDGTPSKIPADYTGTLENGMIYLADINYLLLDSDTAEKVKNAVVDAAAGFENGTKHVFCGPLYNQSGIASVIGGALCGLAGMYMCMVTNSGVWVHGCISGYGWLAVALVIFSAWNPLKSIFCSIIFGALMIMRLYIAIPGLNPFIYDMCPYIVTSIVIIITSIRKTGKDHIPESLGENYYREER